MSDKPNESIKTNNERVIAEDSVVNSTEVEKKESTKKGTSEATTKKKKNSSRAKATKKEDNSKTSASKTTAKTKRTSKKVEKKDEENSESLIKEKEVITSQPVVDLKEVDEKVNEIKKAASKEKKTTASRLKNTKKSTSKTTKSTISKSTVLDSADISSESKEANGKSGDIQLKVETSVDESVKEVNKHEITNFNKYLFHQGRNYETYNILGAHLIKKDDVEGVQFATWAPNARDIYVVGDFNGFQVRDEYKLERVSENGLWCGFFKNAKVGDKYKFCIRSNNGNLGEYKADPYAIQAELRPGNASIIYEPKDFKWTDEKWIKARNKVNVLERPLNIYEIHLGSWKRKENGDFLTYEEISNELPEYLQEMGYTHVEIMPLVEHPLDASWGYQGTSYYAPTSRYGNYEGLKVLINKLHEKNIGVIMDWVPGHFCKDAHGLYRFDGTPTYEYQEEWRAENRGWGTCNFDLGRREVKSFLISNALYWLREFHFDGLRVDAVSSILYLDYSREPGEWVPNKYGGNGNLEAIEFLKELNEEVFNEFPTTLMIAEESTAWPNVTKPPMHDGLGFNMKWNMGWMNDTLEYVQIDPKYRRNNHRNITFAMMYNYAENYLLPLSHDEVVHGKKSLLEKMWGDTWNKFAGLRAFMGYMMGHPGKKLTFMGCEFAQGIEWREYESLEWNLIDDIKLNKQTQLFFKDLNNLYINNKAFWELDHDYRGFNWIEADNNEQSVLIFARRSRNDEDTLIFVINFKPIVYYDYQIGVPFLGEYEELFNSDDSKYGGSGQIMDAVLTAEKVPFQNQPFSLRIKVPPMATLILKIKDIKKEEVDKEEILLEKEILQS